MSLPLEFPPIVADERGFVGRAMMDEIEDLVELWAATEARLVELAGDQQLRYLAGAADPEAVAVRGRELMREVERELDALAARTDEWARGAVRAQVDAGSSAAIASAQGQGLAVSVGGALGVVNTQSIAALVEDILIDADYSAASSLQTMRRFIRRTQQVALDEAAINQSLIISEARLESLPARARRLEREFRAAVGGGDFIVIRGRRYNLSKYARLVARTRLAEAATQGSFDAILAMGIDLVQISDHGKTDPVCDKYAGKVYSISGRTQGYPRLEARPPFHPNCRHAMLPFVAELKTDRELEFVQARSRGDIEPGVSIAEYFEGR